MVIHIFVDTHSKFGRVFALNQDQDPILYPTLIWMTYDCLSGIFEFIICRKTTANTTKILVLLTLRNAIISSPLKNLVIEKPAKFLATHDLFFPKPDSLGFILSFSIENMRAIQVIYAR